METLNMLLYAPSIVTPSTPYNAVECVTSGKHSKNDKRFLFKRKIVKRKCTLAKLNKERRIDI